jgi:DNA replication protein DnaC
LVLDELGYLPCDSRAADILYNIVSRRHCLRATVITTKLAFKQWGNVFSGAACVAALVDRFNQHCHKVTITADSWRETHQFDHDDPPTKPSRSRRKRRS